MRRPTIKHLMLPALILATFGIATAAQPAKSAADHSRSMGTLTITGNNLRLLQDIKAALHRQFSYGAADRDTMVCHIQAPTGSRLHKALVCGTNHAWYTRADQAEINWGAIMRGGTLENIKAVNMAFKIPLVSAADFKRFIQSVPSAKPSTGPMRNGRTRQ